MSVLCTWCKYENFGGGRNFEGPNVERLIVRNLKIANVKSYEVQLFVFFIYELIFYFILNYSNTQIFVFLSFRFLHKLFDNLPNLIFFEIEKKFLINNFGKFINF